LNQVLSVNDFLEVVFDKVIAVLREVLGSFLLAVVVLLAWSHWSILAFVSHLVHHLCIKDGKQGDFFVKCFGYKSGNVQQKQRDNHIGIELFVVANLKDNDVHLVQKILSVILD
jgi:hypothetical protein